MAVSVVALLKADLFLFFDGALPLPVRTLLLLTGAATVPRRRSFVARILSIRWIALFEPNRLLRRIYPYLKNWGSLVAARQVNVCRI